MKTKEFHLCKEGWRLYDIYGRGEYYSQITWDNYKNHRINCSECTKPDKSKLSPVSTLSSNGENM